MSFANRSHQRPFQSNTISIDRINCGLWNLKLAHWSFHWCDVHNFPFHWCLLQIIHFKIYFNKTSINKVQYCSVEAGGKLMSSEPLTLPLVLKLTKQHNYIRKNIYFHHRSSLIIVYSQNLNMKPLHRNQLCNY